MSVTDNPTPTTTVADQVAALIPGNGTEPVPAAVVARVLAGAGAWLRSKADDCIDWDYDPVDPTGCQPYMADDALVGYDKASRAFTAATDPIPLPPPPFTPDPTAGAADPWGPPF